MYIEAMKQPYT